MTSTSSGRQAEARAVEYLKHKSFIAELSGGDEVYEDMKQESGVHRIQRVPATERSGRVHKKHRMFDCRLFSQEIFLRHNFAGRNSRRIAALSILIWHRKRICGWKDAPCGLKFCNVIG